MEGLRNINILVTGGAGFIGGNLVEELIRKNAKVTVLDIEISPKSTFFLKNLQKKCRYINLNINNRSKLSNFFSTYTPDYIIHLAAEPIVENALINPLKTLETNIIGTLNILEEVRKNKKIKGIIVASSDKAYGKTKNTYTEESPLKGDHPYDVSKSSADLISQSYFKTFELPVVITRFGNVYGEGDFHFNRIIPGICTSIINKRMLLIRSNGKYVRDYIYVKDVVSGYLFLLDKFSKVKGEAFNFSSLDTLSVLELIKKAEDILDTKIGYKIINSAKNEIPFQHLNDSKIKSLGWKNQYSLKNSLWYTLNWYKHNLLERKKNHAT